MSPDVDGGGAPERGRLRGDRPGLARRLASLGEMEQVAAVLARIGREEGPDALARVLAAALEDRANLRDPLSHKVLLAATRLLADPAEAALAGSVRDQARSLGMDDLARFVESPPPLLLAEMRKAQVLRGKDGRPLSLGERKSLARNPARTQVDRLLADPSPDVVGHLLESPKLTETDVVRIVSRRPAVPEVLARVARSRKWVARYRVRLALVQNPYLDPALGVKLAALLMQQDRRRVARDGKLHPRLREACDRSLRPRRREERTGAAEDPPGGENPGGPQTH